jgi:sulfatase modifying factor 1
VAATDSNALYSTDMAGGFGAIIRSGSSGSYSSSLIAGRGEMPVNYVTFWDAARFANWLHNDQPTGLQDDTTTEDGAYTLTPTGIANNTVARNASEARVFVTSEDEWYKAAYYDKLGMAYYDYPAATNTETTCTLPGATANTANCGFAISDLALVGSYSGAASPSGTFDQGGNVWEWNEAVIAGSNRGLRGGSIFVAATDLAASIRSDGLPAVDSVNVGFRVARRVHTPLVPSVSSLGMLALWILLSVAGWRRLRLVSGK